MRPAVVAAGILLLGALGIGTAVRGRGPAQMLPPDVGPEVPVVPAAGDGLFEDVTAVSGLDFVHHTVDGQMDDILESIGAGAVALDYDGDGRLDVYLLQGCPKRGTPPPEGGEACGRLYRNQGGMRFSDVTVAAGLASAGGGFSGAAADVDGDGDVDLFVFRDGPNRFFRNRGDGTFEDIAAQAGIAGDACSVAGTLLDADGDGRLDLYVSNYLTFDASYRLHYAPDVFPGPLAFAAEPDILYLGRADGTFEDVSASAGLAVDAGRAMGVVACDFDDDGRQDVFVANDASANHYLHNLGGGHFEEVAEAAGLAFGFHGEATGAMAGVVGDIDLDGRPDLHVTDTHYGSLYHNEGGGRFRDRCYEAGVAAVSAPWVSWGGGFLDADNDGDLDLFVADGDLHHPTGRPDLLLGNRGDGVFEDISARGGPHFRRALLCRAALLADFDDDGAMDVLITVIDGPPVLLRGRPPAGQHWVRFVVQGAPPRAHAHGARVTVRTGERSWVRPVYAPAGYLTQNDPRLHVGLGTAETVDLVEVRWPSGRTESYGPLPADRTHRLVEGEGRP